MDAIDRPPEDASGKPGRRGARTRASYSLAPCAHLFVRFFSPFNRFTLWRDALIDLRPSFPFWWYVAYGLS